MTVTTLGEPQKQLDQSTVIEYHILGVLNSDRRTWVEMVRDAARQELIIPRSGASHMHPRDRRVPCMFCAARTRDINAVSASIILSVAENKFRDDHWNADDIRRADQVASAAKNITIDEDVLRDMFGPHWGMVIAFGYRVEFADARTLVDLLRQALTTPEAARTPRITNGRDWTQPARWLVSSAMSGKRQSADMATKLRQRDQVGRLASLACAMSLNGNVGDSVEQWIPVPKDTAPVTVEEPKLRVVR